MTTKCDAVEDQYSRPGFIPKELIIHAIENYGDESDPGDVETVCGLKFNELNLFHHGWNPIESKYKGAHTCKYCLNIIRLAEGTREKVILIEAEIVTRAKYFRKQQNLSDGRLKLEDKDFYTAIRTTEAADIDFLLFLDKEIEQNKTDSRLTWKQQENK